MKIALDLDGVCYNWDKTARYMLRRKLTQERRPIPTELFSPSRHWDSIQQAIEPADWDWLWDEAINLGLYRYGHCEKGAIEGVEALGKLGDLMIVTSRPHKAYKDTRDWVSFMFDRAQVGALIFNDNKHEVEADLYIDDGPHHALKLHEMGKQIIVFQKPWNDKLPFSVGTQVNNWQAIVDTVKGMIP